MSDEWKEAVTAAMKIKGELLRLKECLSQYANEVNWEGSNKQTWSYCEPGYCMAQKALKEFEKANEQASP